MALHPKNYRINHTNLALLGAFDEDGDGKMSFEEFVKLNEKFPQMLHPAFKVQDSMCVHTLGRDWWLNRRSMFAEERAKKEADAKKAKELEKKKHVDMQKKQIRRRIGWYNYYFNSKMREEYFKDIDYGIDEEEEKRKAKEKAEEERKQAEAIAELEAERARAMRMMNKNPPKQPTKPHITTDFLKSRTTPKIRKERRRMREMGFMLPKKRRRYYEKEKKRRKRERREAKKYLVQPEYSDSDSNSDSS